MLRMVSIGGELARRRVPLSELDYPDAAENERVKEAIKWFEDARLLTPDTDPEGKPYKEPAHDALVRGWPRLLDWKQKHLRELLLQRDLTSDANQWESSGKKKQDSGLLWIEDPRLPTALQLSCGKDYKDNWLNLFRWSFGYQTWRFQAPEHWLNASETDFVWQSFNQKFKRFRNTTITFAGVILALSGLTGYALRNQRLAESRATIAQLREQSANVQNLISADRVAEGLMLAIDTMNQSQSIPDLELTARSSPLTAVQVLQLTAQSSLLTAVQVSQEVNRLHGHEDSVISVAFSPDGQRLVSGSADRTVRLWDARTGQPIGQPLHGHEEVVTSVAFSPNGQRLVSGSDDRTVRLWDVSPNAWLVIACNRLQYHPLLNQPETVITDPELIKASHRASAACQQRGKQKAPTTTTLSWVEQTFRWVAGRFF